jgi:adenosylmethionine-8-amino-7-oxononanoate aminotransferase
VASQRVFDAFLGADLSERTLYHGHSYSGNALAAAVALRHLQLLDEWQVLANVAARAEQLGDRLREQIEPLGAVGEVRRRGLMTGIELVPPAGGLGWGRRVSAACVRRGVLIRPLGDVIVLMPMLTSTVAEIDRIVSTVAEAIEEVCGS